MRRHAALPQPLELAPVHACPGCASANIPPSLPPHAASRSPRSLSLAARSEAAPLWVRVAVAASQQPGGRALPWQAAEQARAALEERLKTVADELDAKATQAEQRVADAKAAAQRTAELEALLQAPPPVPSCPAVCPVKRASPVDERAAWLASLHVCS